MINIEMGSIYCPCIEDTVKLADCKSCVNMKNGECQYKKESVNCNQTK